MVSTGADGTTVALNCPPTGNRVVAADAGFTLPFPHAVSRACLVDVIWLGSIYFGQELRSAGMVYICRSLQLQ